MPMKYYQFGDNFSQIARLETTQRLFSSHVRHATTPYSSLKYHACAVRYPLLHLAKSVYGLVATADGCIDTLDIYLWFHTDGETRRMMKGIGLALANVALNLLGAAVAIIIFITKTLSTLVNMGYETKNIVSVEDKYINSEMNSFF